MTPRISPASASNPCAPNSRLAGCPKRWRALWGLRAIDFPKDKNILGPEQVQALIHQDPEVSQQFGLWDQEDLELVQGNLLVLPVGAGLLYVEPVYLRTSKVGLPSMARIVVSDGRSVAMDESLPLALDQLMKKAPPI